MVDAPRTDPTPPDETAPEPAPAPVDENAGDSDEGEEEEKVAEAPPEEKKDDRGRRRRRRRTTPKSAPEPAASTSETAPEARPAPEPPAPDHPLRDTPRCIITPHQAGPTKDSYPCMGRRAIENLRRWKTGEPLLGEVTAEMLPRMT